MAVEEPILLTEASRDVDGNGRLDQIRVTLSNWHAVSSAAPAEGRVIVSVKLGSRRWVRTDISVLIDRPTMQFMPIEWDLVFDDYNHDGRMDFNLAQQCGSNNSCVWLFTIGRSGRTSLLPVNTVAGFLWINTGGAYSTSAIKVKGACLESWAYEPWLGKGVTTRYCWNRQSRTFEAAVRNPPDY